MNILSVNLGSFFTSKLLLSNYCYDKKIDIVCIQETFEHKAKPHLNGWKCFSKPRKENADNRFLSFLLVLPFAPWYSCENSITDWSSTTHYLDTPLTISISAFQMSSQGLGKTHGDIYTKKLHLRNRPIR